MIITANDAHTWCRRKEIHYKISPMTRMSDAKSIQTMKLCNVNYHFHSKATHKPRQTMFWMLRAEHVFYQNSIGTKKAIYLSLQSNWKLIYFWIERESFNKSSWKSNEIICCVSFRWRNYESDKASYKRRSETYNLTRVEKLLMSREIIKFCLNAKLLQLYLVIVYSTHGLVKCSTFYGGGVWLTHVKL